MQCQPQAIQPTADDEYTRRPAVEGRRAEICSTGKLSFLMEAHDGLSAKIAKRLGFKGLWASGLSIASSLGFRDANEAS
ncbi:2-methylisocitrate lyase-like PEP mutase family enzyme [Bradyrhizobium sp. USDA 4472]